MMTHKRPLRSENQCLARYHGLENVGSWVSFAFHVLHIPFSVVVVNRQKEKCILKIVTPSVRPGINRTLQIVQTRSVQPSIHVIRQCFAALEVIFVPRLMSEPKH